MSADNSIVLSGREADVSAERAGFEVPPELATRYEIRVVDAPGGEQRLGLFLPGNRETPAIEITDNRIVARSEDAETVASLVNIAQHNGWDRIDVHGSPEFRKAVWTAATREGLTVSGYEPSVVEQERMVNLRREDTARREREAAEQPVPAVLPEATDNTISAQPTEAARDKVAQARSSDAAGTELSDDDRRLLLTLSRHAEDRKALYQNLGDDLDAFQAEVEYERIGANRDALNGALERALKSPTLVKAFERSGYEPDELRRMGGDRSLDGEFADALYEARSGLNRQEVAAARVAEREAGAARNDEYIDEQLEGAVAQSLTEQGRRREAETEPVREDQAREVAAERRHESEELAELFLHGGTEKVAGDPRLANALQAQTAMEQHIGEVFDGDASRIASANFESRQMISDALRRGLDVSVREPTPVRQIEPIQTRPDLER